MANAPPNPFLLVSVREENRRRLAQEQKRTRTLLDIAAEQRRKPPVLPGPGPDVTPTPVPTPRPPVVGRPRLPPAAMEGIVPVVAGAFRIGLGAVRGLGQEIRQLPASLSMEPELGQFPGYEELGRKIREGEERYRKSVGAFALVGVTRPLEVINQLIEGDRPKLEKLEETLQRYESIKTPKYLKGTLEAVGDLPLWVYGPGAVKGIAESFPRVAKVILQGVAETPAVREAALKVAMPLQMVPKARAAAVPLRMAEKAEPLRGLKAIKEAERLAAQQVKDVIAALEVSAKQGRVGENRIYLSPQGRFQVGGKTRLVNMSEIARREGLVPDPVDLNYWRLPESARPAAAKEPWQMTEDAFTKQRIAGIENTFHRQAQTKRALTEHRQVVSQALSEGKPVPPEVLADYPDLVAQAAKGAPEVAPPVAGVAERINALIEGRTYNYLPREIVSLAESLKGTIKPFVSAPVQLKEEIARLTDQWFKVIPGDEAAQIASRIGTLERKAPRYEPIIGQTFEVSERRWGASGGLPQSENELGTRWVVVAREDITKDNAYWRLVQRGDAPFLQTKTESERTLSLYHKPVLAARAAPRAEVGLTAGTHLNLGRMHGNRLILEEAGILAPGRPQLTISEIVTKLDEIQGKLGKIPTSRLKGPQFRKLDGARITLLRLAEEESGLTETGLRNVAKGIPPPVVAVPRAKVPPAAKPPGPIAPEAARAAELQIPPAAVRAATEPPVAAPRQPSVPFRKGPFPEPAPIGPGKPPVQPPTAGGVPPAGQPYKPKTIPQMVREAKGMKALTPAERAEAMSQAKPIDPSELPYSPMPFEEADRLLGQQPKLAQLLSKVPGLRRVVEPLNPAQMLRENQVAMLGVRKAIWQEIEISRSRMASMAWWNEAKDVLGFKKTGRLGGLWRTVWRATKAESKQAAYRNNPQYGIIDDLLEHPERYRLTPDQEAVIRVGQNLQTNMLREAQRVGVDAVELGASYWHRIVLKGPREQQAGAWIRGRLSSRKGYTRPRAFEAVDEGVDLGYKYETHPLVRLQARLGAGVQTIADQETRLAIRKLPGAETVGQRVQRTGKDAIEAVATAKQVRAEAKTAYLKTKTPENALALRQAEAEFVKTLSELQAIQAKVRFPNLYEMQLPGGRIAPAELVAEVSKYIELPELARGGGPSVVHDILRLSRVMLTNFDFAAGYIQGQTLFFRNNPAWWKAQAHALVSIVDSPLGYISRNGAVIDEGIRMGAISMPTEFLFAERGIASLPTRLPLLGPTARGFQRAFEWFTFIGQAELYKATRGGKSVDELIKLGSAIRKELGTQSYAILGVRSTQRTVEAMLAFAPRLMRAVVGTVTQALMPSMGAGAMEARKALGSLFAGALALTVGINAAKGESTNFDDPFDNSWLAFKVGKTYYNFFGPLYPYMRTVARMGLLIAEGAEAKAATELRKFAQTKSSIPARAVDIAAQFMVRGQAYVYGRKIEPTLGSLAAGLVGEFATPIGAQNIIEGMQEQRPEAALELLGLVGRPEYQAKRRLQLRRRTTVAKAGRWRTRRLAITARGR